MFEEITSDLNNEDDEDPSSLQLNLYILSKSAAYMKKTKML